MTEAIFLETRRRIKALGQGTKPLPKSVLSRLYRTEGIEGLQVIGMARTLQTSCADVLSYDGLAGIIYCRGKHRHDWMHTEWGPDLPGGRNLVRQTCDSCTSQIDFYVTDGNIGKKERSGTIKHCPNYDLNGMADSIYAWEFMPVISYLNLLKEISDHERDKAWAEASA